MRAVALSLLAYLSLHGPAFASDGALEINQTCATSSAGCFPGDIGGGFPVTITQPGSYRLTSNLALPGGTSGIVLNTTDVHIDLNGSGIVGPASCLPISCPLGTGSGIEVLSIQLGVRSSVANGRVQGMAKDCIQLSGSARVSDVTVSQCGEDGIDAGRGSLVHDNVVQSTGRHGLYFGVGGGSFRGNSIQSSGVRVGSGGISISGGPFGGPGAAIGGNYCEDQRCTRTGAKRFYLSQNNANGAQALTTCASGFHMASLWEIRDLSDLSYDTSLGFTTGNSGSGPPTGGGWVRSGDAVFNNTEPGIASCAGWTTADPSWHGSWVHLESDWTHALTVSPSQLIAPWKSGSDSCDNQVKVWCVED